VLHPPAVQRPRGELFPFLLQKILEVVEWLARAM
jgi:hypothetical protein